MNIKQRCFAHKNILPATVSFMLALVLGYLLLFGMEFQADRTGAIALLFAIVILMGIMRLRSFVKRQAESVSVRIFRTKAGYIVLGFLLGLAAMSMIFNIVYTGDWFDFTDIGFYILSIPTSLVVPIEFDNSDVVKRLVLFGLVAINILLVSFVFDGIGILTLKLFSSKARRG